MNIHQLANLRYLAEIVENIDTDIMIYGDDAKELDNLYVDRYLAELKLKYAMRQMLK